MSDYECPKCKHEFDACGNHEEDEGEQECDECGFKFEVEIEYTPHYDVWCVVHEYGEPTVSRTGVRASFCVYCGACRLEDEKT